MSMLNYTEIVENAALCSEPACYIVDCLISDPKLYAPISVTVHFMAVNSGGGRGVCIHASNSSSGDPLLTAGVGEQP